MRVRALAMVIASLMTMLAVGGPTASAYPVEQLDQQYTGYLTFNYMQCDPETFYTCAQTFTAGISGSLTGVDLQVYGVDDTSILTVAIRAVDSVTGKPIMDQAPLATASSTPGAISVSTPTWVGFDFATSATVTAGVQYAIHFTVAGGGGIWRGQTGDYYAGGSNFYKYGDTQASDLDPSTNDMFFKTYVSVDVADTTDPVVGATIDPTAPDGANGWYTSPVTVSWNVSDPESGIASSTGCAAQTISATTQVGTTITCSATNGDGDTTTESVTVHVDQTAPTLDYQLVRTPDQNGWYNAPVALTGGVRDLESGLNPTCPTIAPAANPYAGPDGQGVTIVATCQNGAGLSNSQTLTFNYDDTDPTITISDQTVEASDANGAPVTFAPTVADATSGVGTVVCVDANSQPVVSGDTFPIGGTTVTCTVTDVAGNTNAASFTLTVEDTIAPVVTVPADIVVNATGQDGAIVTFEATATDATTQNLVVTCAPPSGSPFPVGTTTVTCSATDQYGNTGSSSFTATVVGADQGLGDLREMVESLRISGAASTVTSVRRNLLMMVDVAEMFADADQPQLACLQLARFDLEVRAQVSRRRVTESDAASLYAKTAEIRSMLGCGGVG